MPVGLIMNQNKTLAMFTIQIAYVTVGVSEVRRRGEGGRTNTVEVETIAEHQLPETHGLDFERFDRAEKGEAELKLADERQVQKAKRGKLTEAE